MPLSVSHTFQYDCGFKEIAAQNKLTPFFIREQCGPRLTPTIRHIMAYDGRDNSVFPTNGIYFRTTTELIGDRLTNYGTLKNESHVELNVPLFAGAALQLCGRLGKIYEDRKLMKETCVDSLFFLGGPQTLRGFDMAGATPVKDGVPCGTRVSKKMEIFGSLKRKIFDN
jgi:outer membrane protein insertion porin family